MRRRRKISIFVLFIIGLCLLLLRLNPRIPLSSSTILQFAASRGYYSIVASQLTIGVDPDGPDRTPLWSAIARNDKKMAELLVSKGADLERQFQSGEPNGPPLAWALEFHRLEISKMLLRHGADPNYRPKYGKNRALEIATELGDQELIDLLQAKRNHPARQRQ